MRRSRWLAGWKGSATKPVIYHCISRVVDRRFVFEERECEAFRMFFRMYENFSGCRVLSYCVMSNHFHLLLEVPPMADGGLSDEELLQRLGGLYSEVVVAGVAAELAEARKLSIGEIDGAANARVAAIHARFTYRMHDLSEFMKGLLIRFTRWFNRVHSRSGTLWEERFKSVIVESGVAARTMAAYIDFGDGAVIGSKEFVNEAFARARERFSAKRKDGARAMRGSGSGAKGLLWSARDLRVRV